MKLLAWLFAAIEVIFLVILAIWFLALPSVFECYYPLLRASPHHQDAAAVVQWLSSDHRQRSLNLALANGKFSEKELRHYADVRRVLQRLPVLLLVLAAAGAGLAAAAGRQAVYRAQARALILWLVVILVIGGFALWDWREFFAWAHQPFFGDRSWRLPNRAYSLQLFPALFWRWTTAVVLLIPSALLAAAAFAARCSTLGSATASETKTNPLAPAGKTPTTP